MVNPEEWVTPFEPEIQRLAGELGDPQSIYDWMRNVRYVVDFKLKKPIVTLHTLQGDCDEQSTLLASLLIAIGEKAYVRIAEFPGHPILHAWVVWYDMAYGVWRNLDPSGTIRFVDLGYGESGGPVIIIYVDFNNSEVFDYGFLWRVLSVFQ